MPIVEKRELDRFGRWTRNRRKRVPPRAEAATSTQIFVSDFHPPEECPLAVDDYFFWMFREFDRKRKADPRVILERPRVDSPPPQLVNVPPRQRTGPDLVVKKVDRHALARLGE